MAGPVPHGSVLGHRNPSGTHEEVESPATRATVRGNFGSRLAIAQGVWSILKRMPVVSGARPTSKSTLLPRGTIGRRPGRPAPRPRSFGAGGPPPVTALFATPVCSIARGVVQLNKIVRNPGQIRNSMGFGDCTVRAGVVLQTRVANPGHGPLGYSTFTSTLPEPHQGAGLEVRRHGMPASRPRSFGAVGPLPLTALIATPICRIARGGVRLIRIAIKPGQVRNPRLPHCTSLMGVADSTVRDGGMLHTRVANHGHGPLGCSTIASTLSEPHQGANQEP